MVSIPEDTVYYNDQGDMITVKYRIDNHGEIVETTTNTKNRVKRVRRIRQQGF